MQYQALTSLFMRAAQWSIYEIGTFNAIVSCHYVLLFMVMPVYEYGIVSLFLSSIYTVASFATMGNDITSYRVMGTERSQQSIRTTLLAHGLHAFLISFICICLIIIMYAAYISVFMSICMVSCFLLVTEIMRKISKSILFTLHYFGPVAHIEIASVICYMTIVWGGSYLYGYYLTPFFLIITLLFCSCITNILFARLLIIEYSKAPAGDLLSWKQIVLIKCSALMCSTTRFVFSGNSIVPLTAAFMGTTYAGGIKVAQTLIQNGTTLADRIFCMNSALLFSYLHTANNCMILQVIYRMMIPLLCIGTISIYGLIYMLMYYKGMLSLLPLISLYMIMQILDIGTTIFERFLLAQSNPYLLYIQFGTTTVCGAILYCGAYIGYVYMLCALVITRFISLCFVVHLTRVTHKGHNFENSRSHILPFEFSALQVDENKANQDRL